ncbi:MAG: glycosyltransferase, partial [Pseudomonadota bacterium]
MARIPNIVHFVFGLREQLSAFHPIHFLAIESCRQILKPDEIFLHYDHLPFGVYWDAIRPHLTLCRVGQVEAVEMAEYDDQLVPLQYRYAHHADFVRLDALIEHGGIYADVDTLFLKPIASPLFEKQFVIGREDDAPDERTDMRRPSLCNAFLMAEPDAQFARVWRERMSPALNGTWNNHSCLLPQELSGEMPDTVHIEPVSSFYKIPCTAAGIRSLLEKGDPDLSDAYSIHLWEHVWWKEDRPDFTQRHAGEFTADYIATADVPYCRLARQFLPRRPSRSDRLP